MLAIAVELEESPRLYLKAASYEDEQRLLLALDLDELHELVDSLAAYIEERT